jgi:hypothetical protein
VTVHRAKDLQHLFAAEFGDSARAASAVSAVWVEAQAGLPARAQVLGSARATAFAVKAFSGKPPSDFFTSRRTLCRS